MSSRSLRPLMTDVAMLLAFFLISYSTLWVIFHVNPEQLQDLARAVSSPIFGIAMIGFGLLLFGAGIRLYLTVIEEEVSARILAVALIGAGALISIVFTLTLMGGVIEDTIRALEAITGGG